MSPGLMHVVGPLVKLLSLPGLTWEDRARISDAIYETRKHWDGMKQEQDKDAIPAQACEQTAQPIQSVAQDYREWLERRGFDAPSKVTLGQQIPKWIQS